MKILEVEIPDELEQGFKLWCNIVDYPFKEKYFIDFIIDAGLHGKSSISKEAKIYITNTQLCFDGCYIFNLKNKYISPLITDFIEYLNKVNENIK